jgi:dihydrodipicolinate reductase
VGEHTVIFAGAGNASLTHRAGVARLAVGAARGALVIDQPAGLYRMEDVLGL